MRRHEPVVLRALRVSGLRLEDGTVDLDSVFGQISINFIQRALDVAMKISSLALQLREAIQFTFKTISPVDQKEQ